MCNYHERESGYNVYPHLRTLTPINGLTPWQQFTVPFCSKPYRPLKAYGAAQSLGGGSRPVESSTQFTRRREEICAARQHLLSRQDCSEES
jgi:hypothetical protein